MLLDARVQAIVDELTQRIKGDGERLRAGADRYSDDMVQAAGPDAASFLNLLIRAKDARLIVEVGTSVGYTALYMGDAARATGGRVIGTEVIEKKHAQAVEYLRRAGLDGVVEVRKGDARDVILGLDIGSIDIAFLDAQKSDYCEQFDLLLPRMKVGGCIVGDNITYPERIKEMMQRYQAHVRAVANVRSHYLSVGSGLELSVRIA